MSVMVNVLPLCDMCYIILADMGTIHDKTQVLIRLAFLEKPKPWNFRAEGRYLPVYVLDRHLKTADEWLVA
jgi:hypothetical protein